MTERLTHPQPVGAFPMPAGLFLVPEGGAEVDEARRALVAGRLPGSWPDQLRAHELAHAGDLPAALSSLTGDDAVSAYNRWVLDPASADVETVAAALPESVRPLVAAVAFSLGEGAAPADPDASVPADVRGLVLAARATAALEEGDVDTAVATLLSAVDCTRESSVALAAVLLGNVGTLSRRLPVPDASDRASAALAEAASMLAETDLREARAELLLELGGLVHERAAAGSGDERALLQDAMRHYYDGLQLVTETSSPYLWASLNMNLAAAHLAVPMTQASDQLRLGVATQSLRACRRVFTPEDHPAPWSSATLNLANALVYTPSTHQADNLVESVELYEEVLTSGVRDDDPVARARVLANQGNALAHLGAFDVATAKLVEARFVFEEHLDHDAASSVRGVLDEIARAQVTDPEEDLAALAHRAEQLARMPQPDGSFTSGMGVTIAPRPKVTVLAPGQTHPDLPASDPTSSDAEVSS